MDKKSVLELKRRMKKNECTFTKVCGCYVDGNKNKVVSFWQRHIRKFFIKGTV